MPNLGRQNSIVAETDRLKFGTRDYVGDFTSKIRRSGASRQYCEMYALSIVFNQPISRILFLAQ